MHVSGTKPSSVILSLNNEIWPKSMKLIMIVQKCTKRRSRMGGIWCYRTHVLEISRNFVTENFKCVEETDDQPKLIELGYMCPRGLLVHQQWHSPCATKFNVLKFSEIFKCVWRNDQPKLIEIGYMCRRGLLVHQQVVQMLSVLKFISII